MDATKQGRSLQVIKMFDMRLDIGYTSCTSLIIIFNMRQTLGTILTHLSYMSDMLQLVLLVLCFDTA